MSVIMASDPPFQNVARHMGKLMDQLQKGYSNFAPGEIWAPSVNLYETDLAYLVCVDLAGVDKEKIDITVEQQMLRLHGQRNVPAPGDQFEPPVTSSNDQRGKRIRVHLMEIDHGSFSREVELPHDVVQDKIAAHYRNGLLWVELPKK